MEPLKFFKLRLQVWYFGALATFQLVERYSLSNVHFFNAPVKRLFAFLHIVPATFAPIIPRFFGRSHDSD